MDKRPEWVVSICKIHGMLARHHTFQRGKHKNGKTKYRCKICTKKAIKRYEIKNREKYLKRKRNYELNNKKRIESRLSARLKREFGLSLEDYNLLKLKQNNSCKICGKNEAKISKITLRAATLAVDHCHKTGKIRGLLCIRCNGMLGMASDSIDILSNAIKYLKDN